MVVLLPPALLAVLAALLAVLAALAFAALAVGRVAVLAERLVDLVRRVALMASVIACTAYGAKVLSMSRAGASRSATPPTQIPIEANVSSSSLSWCP